MWGPISWDPRDVTAQGVRLTPPAPAAALAPKCPVIQIEQLRAARARRLARGGARRPAGGAA